MRALLPPSPPLLSGDLDLAEQRLAAALKQFPDEPLLVSLQGMLHARRNQTDLALECVRRALESPRSFGHTHHTYYHIACVYAVLGDTDKAMAWWNAVSTPVSRAGRFSGSIHISNTCAKSPHSHDSSLTLSRHTLP